MNDPEIEAMSAVATAIGDLDEAARGRVLRWAAERYVVPLETSGQQIGVGRNGAGAGIADEAIVVAEEQVTEEGPAFEHFAELFAQARPKTDQDRALVAAYWVQVHEGQSQWPSRLLNVELKHLGHSVRDITNALSGNIKKKPPRVIQLKKSGGARQANKTYKVTNEGIVYVQGLLSGGNG